MKYINIEKGGGSLIRKKDRVYQILCSLEKSKPEGITASDISKVMDTDRANISRYLNQLYRNKKLKKIKGRPVLYHSLQERNYPDKLKPARMSESIDNIIGARNSLRIPIQQAKAAVLYPPRGLHTLLLGETGVGKSMFAELMFDFSVESGMINDNAPFIQFNCADYVDNPQLIMAQIFGVRKGAYTGATSSRDGLLKKADGGILFLDEVHRLSPQGQEMLFTFIDKGYFRPLGETENKIKAEVQIIAATTEDPQSYLLRTFIRRIPMTITLPALNDRGLEERFNLIESFLEEESKRLGEVLYINRNSLISFLLYHCTNNIGQLCSDIQLACAKAFLNYRTKDRKYILISQSELPNHVKKGLMKIHSLREDVDLLLKEKGEILQFSVDNKQDKSKTNMEAEYFYDIIEEKLLALRQDKVDDHEINQILNIDIESHFKKHLENLPELTRRDEITQIVGPLINETVEEILSLAQRKLERKFDRKIHYGLALHLQKCIERLENGDRIYHPELNYIRVNYPDEFIVAMEIAKLIDNRFEIEIPLDEIGYLTMFLVENPYRTEKLDNQKVGIVVIMHGKSTASSMVDVANKLVGVKHAVGFDMPLNVEPEVIYKQVLLEVKKQDRGNGVIILVDMGSLTGFGEMITEETGIRVKTIDKVSTPLVIDACRKALLNQGIYEIYNSCYERSSEIEKIEEKGEPGHKYAIITACFTGEGASEKLKQIINQKLNQSNELEIISLNILNRRHFLNSLSKYRDYYNLLAITGTVDVEVDDIPFISAVEILSGDGINTLQQIIKEEELYEKIRVSLSEHLQNISSEQIIDDVRKVIAEIEKVIKVKASDEVKVGIVLHICFLLDKLAGGGSGTYFANLAAYIERYNNEIEQIKKCLALLEESYKVELLDDEIAYICEMFLKND